MQFLAFIDRLRAIKFAMNKILYAVRVRTVVLLLLSYVAQ